MIDKFKDIPNTTQGIQIYKTWAQNEIKRSERKIKVLQEHIGECNSRLANKGGDNAGKVQEIHEAC